MIVSKNAHKTADSGLTVAYFGLLFSSAVVEIEMVIVSFNARRWPQPPVLRHTKSMSVKACRSQTSNEGAANLWALTIGTTRPSPDGVSVKIFAALMSLSVAGNRRLIQQTAWARQMWCVQRVCCNVPFTATARGTSTHFLCCSSGQKGAKSLYTCSVPGAIFVLVVVWSPHGG
jgi:hypothetical protein